MTIMMALTMFLAGTPAGAAGERGLTIAVENLRNTKGVVHACLTRNPAHFPDCSGDPHALKQTVAADRPVFVFAGPASGRYAVTVFHDENSNHKLDMFLGIPREGFGFSRDPVIRFGPPRFDQVAMHIAPGQTRLAVRMQYML